MSIFVVRHFVDDGRVLAELAAGLALCVVTLRGRSRGVALGVALATVVVFEAGFAALQVAGVLLDSLR